MNTISKKDKRLVAVFGATGHTRRFVVTELSRRGMTPVAIARDPEALKVAGFSSPEVIRQPAIINGCGGATRGAGAGGDEHDGRLHRRMPAEWHAQPMTNVS
jgi:uncharacterized protein YbjT (DUF2867 family)